MLSNDDKQWLSKEIKESVKGEVKSVLTPAFKAELKETMVKVFNDGIHAVVLPAMDEMRESIVGELGQKIDELDTKIDGVDRKLDRVTDNLADKLDKHDREIRQIKVRLAL